MKDYYATNGLNGMRDDLVAYAMAHQIGDEDVRKAISDAVSLELNSVGRFIETVYGLEDRDPNLAEIAAGAAVVFAANGFLEIGKDGRANAMARAMLRDAGEVAPIGTSWPDPKDDPAKTEALSSDEDAEPASAEAA